MVESHAETDAGIKADWEIEPNGTRDINQETNECSRKQQSGV